MSERPPVWVTGASGFLGGAVCVRLAGGGHAVRPVVREPEDVGRLPSSGGKLLREPVVCDLAVDELRLDGPDAAPATIVHFAAEIPTGFEAADLEMVAARNRSIDDNVFALAAAVGAGVVFASSGSVYGEGRGQLFIEDGPVAPELPYARAKLRSEHEGSARLADAGFAALRISAPYGPRQRSRTVVRHFLSSALAGEDLHYHGTGNRMQDFVFVEDVAEAVARSVPVRHGGVFNIASGEPVTMRRLAELVVEVAGTAARVVASGERDAQEGRTARYSIDAARSALGWEPATPLRRGLEAWRDHLVGGGS